MQLDMLDKLHSAHQGIQKCCQRAQQSIWWLGLSRQLANVMNKCSICTKERHQPPEPLLPSKFPLLPWQKVGTDLFYHKNVCYLLIVDYYSRYIETAKLSNESSTEVISHTRSIFARHGIPQKVVSDNGLQFSSIYYKNFTTEYGFLHTTSSPRFPQSNGKVERAVKTLKNLLKKAEDPYNNGHVHLPFNSLKFWFQPSRVSNEPSPSCKFTNYPVIATAICTRFFTSQS